VLFWWRIAGSNR